VVRRRGARVGGARERGVRSNPAPQKGVARLKGEWGALGGPGTRSPKVGTVRDKGPVWGGAPGEEVAPERAPGRGAGSEGAVLPVKKSAGE